MRCNEYRRTSLPGQNVIRFRFAAPPFGVRICLGDMDPITGNSLEDANLFRLYHVLQNSQAYYNNKARKRLFTKEEANGRKHLRREIAEAFERDHGYAPDEEDLSFFLEQLWPTPNMVSLETMIREDEYVFEKDPRFEDPAAVEAFPGEESDDTEALREFAGTLSGRLLDVYRMMLERVDAGAEQPQWQELARNWGVSPAQVSKDKAKVIGMIKEYSRRVKRFSYDGAK